MLRATGGVVPKVGIETPHLRRTLASAQLTHSFGIGGPYYTEFRRSRRRPSRPSPTRALLSSTSDPGWGTVLSQSFHACEPVLPKPSVRSAAKYAGPELPESIAVFRMKSSVLRPLILTTWNSRSP